MAVPKQQQKANAEAFASMFSVIHLRGQNEQVAPIDGDSTMDCGKPVQGKRYWSQTCPKCGKEAPFFEDRTGGEFKNPLKVAGYYRFHTSCPHCGQNVSAFPGTLHSVLWDG